MHNPICGGTVNPYPTNAKDNLLREEKDGSIKQFEVNAPYKGLRGCIKRSDIFFYILKDIQSILNIQVMHIVLNWL